MTKMNTHTRTERRTVKSTPMFGPSKTVTYTKTSSRKAKCSTPPTDLPKRVRWQPPPVVSEHLYWAASADQKPAGQNRSKKTKPESFINRRKRPFSPLDVRDWPFAVPNLNSQDADKAPILCDFSKVSFR